MKTHLLKLVAKIRKEGYNNKSKKNTWKWLFVQSAGAVEYTDCTVKLK